MRLRTYMLGMMLLSMPVLCAQSEDFDTFRQRIMNDYQDFPLIHPESYMTQPAVQRTFITVCLTQ